jgi:sugar phosphate isomerase/epimerase
MKRRDFLRILGGTTAGAGVAGLAPRLTTAERLDRIGLQLYTVRQAMARDFEGTLSQVAAVGYREVEFAGYYDRAPKAVRAALDAAGLDSPSAHVGMDVLQNQWRQTLEAANLIGHRYLVVPWIPEEARKTLDGYQTVAALFNRAAGEARKAGIQFAYHNHEFEFTPMDGRVPYDVLLEETDRDLVRLEMDLFWITHGGGKPLDYFARYPGRSPLVHVKDMDGTSRHAMADVGQGVIDFKRIFKQRRQAGIKYLFVEHDQPPSPFDSIRASYVYLRRLQF